MRESVISQRMSEINDQVDTLEERLDSLRRSRTYPYESWDEQIRPLRAEIAKLMVEYWRLFEEANPDHHPTGEASAPEGDWIGCHR